MEIRCLKMDTSLTFAHFSDTPCACRHITYSRYSSLIQSQVKAAAVKAFQRNSYFSLGYLLWTEGSPSYQGTHHHCQLMQKYIPLCMKMYDYKHLLFNYTDTICIFIMINMYAYIFYPVFIHILIKYFICTSLLELIH